VRRRNAVALVVVFALAFPAGALAQRSPPKLREAPPGMGKRGKQGAAGARAGNRKLPATGTDAGLVGLAGMGLLMAGFGLRLRLPGG